MGNGKIGCNAAVCDIQNVSLPNVSDITGGDGRGGAFFSVS